MVGAIIHSPEKKRLTLCDVASADGRISMAPYQDVADLYSVYSEKPLFLDSRNYIKYENFEKKEVSIKNNIDFDLHILHLKNVYIINELGILTEDGILIHQNYVSRNQHAGKENQFIKTDMFNIKKVMNIPVIKEDVFFCDQMQHGWGHFILENISKLWASSRLDKKMRLATNVNLKIIQECLDALGETRLSPFLYGSAVFCKSLYVATQPMFIYSYATQQAQDVWKKIGAAYGGERSPYGRNICVSRKNIDHRNLSNADEVEHMLAQKGFEMHFPEKMSFKDQLRLFSGVEKIASLYGSGLFGGLFAQNPSSIFMIAPSASFCRHFLYFDEQWAAAAYVEGRKKTETWRADWTLDNVDYLSEALSERY